MQIKTVETLPLDWSGDALALGFYADAVEMSAELAAIDTRLDGTIAELIAETEFTGKAGSSAVARVGSHSPVRKIILVGVGAEADYSPAVARTAAAAIARIAKQQKVKTLGIRVPMAEDVGKTAQMLTEGLHLSLHVDNRFKSDPQDQGAVLESVDLLALGSEAGALATGAAIASGVILARELVAAPANSVTPLTLAALAQDLASEYGLELKILEQADCEALGMGSFLGVAQASELPPKFIHLTYQPSGTPRRKVAIVGKGLTFDSGGLNLKTGGSGIETMKMDMGGAAATFGAAKAIAQLKPDVEVHFISAATENMISGKAMHPGDILTASNGKTIEVNNTDAEGRLTLADALVYADKLGMDAIVDLATLTGACIVALGDTIGGLWSPNADLAAQLQTAATQGGEKFWTMPLETAYFEGLKSPIADMKNTGPRAGGSITAALFLKEFVDKTPWAHLDIAGPVWADKENGVNNAGATGYPVQTLVNWVLQ